MNAAIPDVLRPSTILHALRANLSAEPEMIFVYLLLLVVPWVVWQGLRTGEPDPVDPGTSRAEEGDDPGRPLRASSPGEGRRGAVERRPGRVDRVE